MKKEGKVLAIIFIASIILILSVNIVSASLLGDLGNLFGRLFGGKEKTNLKGELGTAGVFSLNNLSANLTPLYQLHKINTGGIWTFYYTTSASERDIDVSQYGYIYDGIKGYVYNTNVTNTNPIYKLHTIINSIWYFYFATGVSDKNGAISSGYTYDNLVGYISLVNATGSNAFHQLHKVNADGGWSFYYAAGEGDKNGAISSGYTYDRIKGYMIQINDSSPNPLYQLHAIGSNGVWSFYYAVGDVDKNGAISSGYTYDRIKGYISQTNISGSVPLYQLHSVNTNGMWFFYYAAGEGDKNGAISVGYTYDKIKGYISQTNGSNLSPLYQLHKINADGSWTFYYANSEGDKNGAISSGYTYDKIKGYVFSSQCIPDCLGKQCGDNGCGGYCGSYGGGCPAGQTCNATGQCIQNPIIKCNNNSQCGTNGYSGNTFCFNGSVYQNYTTYTCNNPGTTSSSCTNSTSAKLKQNCTTNRQTCGNGQCLTTSDNTYPQFSNYWDNNGIISGSVALFNITLTNTNGTVLLSINGINYTAKNLTKNIYNVSIVGLVNGIYSYRWLSWGNGTNRNYNISELRSYTVNSTPVEKLNATISIATLKDSYAINEAINITDPPDEVLINNVVTKISNFGINNYLDVNQIGVDNPGYFYSSYNNIDENINIVVREGMNIPIYNLSENQTKYKGYIVEFEDKPLVIKDKELKDAEKNASQIIVKTMSYTNAKKSITKLQKDNKKQYDKYKKDIAKKKKKIEKSIQKQLKKKKIVSVTGNAIANNLQNLNVVQDWSSVFNGALLDINSSEAEKIKSIPGVKSITPNLEVHVNMMDTIPLIGADKVWQLDADGNNCLQTKKPCLTGKNVTIGIIDTGIDYTHADLGGCFGSTCKVVGGYDFVNRDNDPMDDQGHGTHVAGTAAGTGAGGLKGVAPDAKLYAYKVCNSGGSCYWNDVISAINRSVDPNQDGNFSDHLDIISLSLGGPGNPDDAPSKTIDYAVESGVIAVISAGNSGPSASTIGSPGCARKAITVGASNNDIGRTSQLYINNIFYNSNGVLNSLLGSLSNALLKNVSGNGTQSDFLSSGDFHEKVALIKRGDITLFEKVKNAENAGALGVIIYNDQPGNFQGLSYNKTAIPVITISKEDGLILLNMINSGNLLVNLNIIINASYPYQIADFSSRGPVIWSGGYLIKPDIVAPGVNICSAEWDSAWSTRKCLDDKHVAISGTSMAAPHVSGAAALLKQRHPDWNPDEIKQLLKNTANDLGLDMNTQGAGRINLTNAIKQNNRPMFAEIIISKEINGIININGTASCSDFSNYTLKYSSDNINWNLLYNGYREVKNGILMKDLDSSTTFSEGINYIKLIVGNRLGETKEVKTSINVKNLYLNYPYNNDIFKPGVLLDVNGTIMYSSFSYYTIEYSKGLDYNNLVWKSDGIILTNGNKKIMNGQIAKWNTSSIRDSDYYNLRLTIFKNDGSKEYKYIWKIYFEPRLKENFPVYVPFTLTPPIANPWSYNYVQVADINKDNKKEIITLASGDILKGTSSKLMVFNSNGILLWSKETVSSNDNGIFSIGDINNDGYQEIVISGDGGCSSGYCKINAYNYDGSIVNGWPRYIGGGLFVSSIFDINHDGKNEIIVLPKIGYYNFSSKLMQESLYIMNGSGNIVAQTTFYTNPNSLYLTGSDYPLALGNFDNDPDLEIVILYAVGFDTYLNIFDTNLNPLLSSPIKLANQWSFHSSIVTADINKDGYSEILSVLTNCTDPVGMWRYCYDSKIHVFDRYGKEVDGWPVNVGQTSLMSASLAVADINQDGYPEIIFPKKDSAFLSEKIFNRTGGKVNEQSIFYYGAYHADEPMSNIIGDINNDGKLDILTSMGGINHEDASGVGGIYAIDTNRSLIDLNNNPSYNTFFKENSAFRPDPKYGFYGAVSPPPIITDLDNNGKLDIIASSFSDHSYDKDSNSDLGKNRASIYAWEIDSTFNPSLAPWPMYQHDPQHTGCYDCNKNLTYLKPQSKLVNAGNSILTGNLIFAIQKNISNVWQNRTVIQRSISIPANGLTKLDTGKDNLGNQVFEGFNNLNVKASSTGDYRVYARFENNLGFIESNWEFKVA